MCQCTSPHCSGTPGANCYKSSKYTAIAKHFNASCNTLLIYAPCTQHSNNLLRLCCVLGCCYFHNLPVWLFTTPLSHYWLLELLRNDWMQVKHVIVCGHYGCGAVKAALQLPTKTPGLVNCWISDIRECRNKHETELKGLNTNEQVSRWVAVRRLSSTELC